MRQPANPDLLIPLLPGFAVLAAVPDEDKNDPDNTQLTPSNRSAAALMAKWYK